MAQVYAARYLGKALASTPRDLLNAAVSRFKPIHPTVLILHCTFVCDARCEMCNNWTRGDRKSDLTLEEIDRMFNSGLWKRIENANISGGEPTTRNDLVEMCQILLDKLPQLRKLGINTTGLTPHRAIPMLTKLVEATAARGVIFSARVSIDGVGQMHNDVRKVTRGFDKANETIRAMQALQKQHAHFNFGISTTIFSHNIGDADNIAQWARENDLDIVFNMVRFTDPMLGNQDLAATCQPIGDDEVRMREFFLDRVRFGPTPGRTKLYSHALRRHDRQRLPSLGALSIPDTGNHGES